MENDKTSLIRCLQERKNYLLYLLRKAVKQDEKLKDIPVHKIRVQKHGKGYQYYIRSDSKDTSGTYLRKNQESIAGNIMQKEYIEQAILILQKELSLLDKYLVDCPPDQILELYDSLNEGRKRLIKPLVVNDDEFVKRWLAVEYQGKEFFEGMPEYYTQKMERVRSKSEIIIANTLQKYNIPYRYEYPIYVKGMGKVYPDFTVLNVKQRKEMYIEHLGLIDDAEYRNNALQKIELYEQNDIFIGDKLIVTCESSAHPLNVKALEKKIRKYLV